MSGTLLEGESLSPQGIQPRDRQQAEQRARLILTQVLPQAPMEFQNRITVGSAISIYKFDNGFDYWRIPLLIGNRNVGFIDLSPTLELLRNRFRISSGSSIDSLPLDLTEMDTNTLLSQLSTFDKIHTQLLGQPSLVSLGSPTRLAWQCQVSNPQTNETRILYATPGFVWEERPRRPDVE
ncbi:MAG: hypothetical protein IM504_15565 [Microcystis sp. M038S2]|jgi:hypothetical protein|uniref:hypothetical protein n=1 Tax=unclassified Microcystis TaxID=2643300 RepID=UPI002589E263|nr:MULTISPECIES: hypothetical protein [unclassified Microcystis]NCR42971.1 hypothetical protein [Microcystis aeruginosa SX13-01]NCS48533.1 hypothetical protein [Microcystis aeruginosa BK11-02]MCA2685044.1 hypothetical protein [Microcystis sp. M046S2]MCA2706211.1 hypothetical protein [Microcystis sp. M038S2]MCA2951928.1 hypothetical protein [Microcystis sp. M112S1]